MRRWIWRDEGGGGGTSDGGRIEPILAQGTRVKYRRTGKLLPDVKFRPGANFAGARARARARARGNTLRRD